MKSVLIVLFFSCAVLHGQHSDFGEVDFTSADSIAMAQQGASLKNLPLLTHKLTSPLTSDLEKFRAIYTWVCTNIENDYGAYQKTIKKRKKLLNKPKALRDWNESYIPKVFKKMLNHKKTACTGYAYLVRELASLADINCKIINGYGRTPTLALDEESIPNHSWNAVELNGKWYLCDPTWSAGKIILEDEGPRFEADYFDAYFLAEPNLFAKNHFPLDATWALTDDSSDLYSFFDGPVVYRDAFSLNLTPIAPIEMHLELLKNSTASFVLSATKNFKSDAIDLVLKGTNTTKEVRPKITRNQNEYILEHNFEKTGKFDVHIRVDETIIATYVVRVKRK